MTSTENLGIVITGPVGAGKSTTADVLVDVLADHEISTAGIDMDYLRRYSPIPKDDPFGVKLGLLNFASVGSNYFANNINMLVIADVVESREQRSEYEHALPNTRIVIVRLAADIEELVRRLEARESESTIDWYRKRAPELQRIMEEAGVGDIVIDVGSRTPQQIANEIASKLSLI